MVFDTSMVVAPIEKVEFDVIRVDSTKSTNYVPIMRALDVVFDELENMIVKK